MNHPVRFEIHNDIDWVGETFIRGKLFDIGRYPGAVKDILGTRSRIKGEVLLVRSPKKVFRILDEYEGFDSNLINKSEYRREKDDGRLLPGPDNRRPLLYHKKLERCCHHRSDNSSKR